MKQIILKLCIFFALATVASAAEFQNCIDKDGNAFLTNKPPLGAKCESTGIENVKSMPDKQNQTQDKTIDGTQKEEKKPDAPSIAEETIKKLIQSCVVCCTNKKQVFLNMNPDLRLGEALFEECVATCKSEGNSSSEWSDCWFQSEI
jgi:hypothetical protein